MVHHANIHANLHELKTGCKFAWKNFVMQICMAAGLLKRIHHANLHEKFFFCHANLSCKFDLLKLRIVDIYVMDAGKKKG